MVKRLLKPSVGLRPVPVVLVTSVGEEGHANVITLAWVGVVCSLPPMVSIAVRPERFSHDLIKATGGLYGRDPARTVQRPPGLVLGLSRQVLEGMPERSVLWDFTADLDRLVACAPRDIRRLLSLL